MSTDRHTWAPDPAGPPDPAPTTARYALLDRLGAGGMGEVWRALDQELGRTVALKLLRPELATKQVARFLNEARATAQLEHRGIVPVHDVGRLPDGRLFYVMQEIRGETFASAIAAVHAASGDGPWREAADGRTFLALIAVFEDVCDTLAYAHARGVLHRDLKPENVMLGAFGEVHVVDWGLVKRIGTSDPGEAEATDAPQLAPGGTLVGQVAGTLGYMSPEQLAGRVDDLGRASDVYSLGAILYHVLTGGPPSAWAAPRFDDPRAPPELVAICRRALDPEPSRRFRDAGALAAAVRRWREEETARTVRDARIAAAERAFLDLDGPGRDRAREVLLWLVDADGHAVPRRSGEVAQGHAEPGARDADAALRAGLAVVRGDTLHLADPGLLGWERLRGWIEADRAGQRLRHALGAAAATWEAGGRRAADLWQGERLAQARQWRRASSPWLSAGEGQFLDTSELAERRRRRLAGATALGVGLGLATAAIVATVAWRQSERALAAEQEARREAVARGLAAEVARRELADQPHAAMAFDAARAALTGGGSPRGEWLAARHGGLTVEPGDPDALDDDPTPPEADPRAFRVAGGLLTRLDPASGATLWTVDTGLPGVMWADAGLSPSLVLASDHGGSLVALDARTGARLGRYDGLDTLSLANAVDPTGQFVASGVFGGSVDLWEARAGVRVGRIALEEVGPVQLTFTPDGLSVIARSPQSTSRWSPPALRRGALDACPSTSAAPSPDHARLLLLGNERSCIVDLTGGAPAQGFPVTARFWTHDSELWALEEAVGGRGSLSAYASNLSGWRELDVPGGGWLVRAGAAPLRITRGGARTVLPAGVPVATGGRWLVEGDSDRVDVADVQTGARWARLPAEVRVQVLAEVGVWGDRVAAGATDGTVSVWSLPTSPAPDAPPPAPDLRLVGAPTPVSVVVGAGDRLLVGHADGSFEVFGADGRAQASGRAWADLVTALALDPSGERLLVGVGHASFAVWHLPTGRPLIAITRGRRGLLHSVGWTAAGQVWGAGTDGAWTWAVPDAPRAPLELTNLRACEGSLRVVAAPGESGPWASRGDPRCADAPPGDG